MGSTPNGISGLKVFPEQHDAMADSCAWTKLVLNLKFISLERHAILGQALSWARVVQTGEYRSTISTKNTPSYDAALIHAVLRLAITARGRWSLFFARR
jgi:LPS sulfotransferase NodH